MTTRRKILVRIAAASIPAAGASAAASALFGVRISSPAVVFLATLSLLPTKPLSPPSPSPITPVVLQSRVPRRTLILVLLSLAAVSFLLDGLAYVAYAILNSVWRPGTGVELASVLGLIAYAGLAALGAYKDVNNIEIWSRKRVKAAIFAALALDVAQVVLLVISAKAHDPTRICDSPKLSKCIPETFHFFMPLLRVLFLLPLLFTLFSPRVVYVPADLQPETTDAENAPLVGQPSLLLQEEGNGPSSGGESSKYGTFALPEQTDSGPAPSAPEVKTGSLKSESSLGTLRRLSPYVFPARGLVLSVTLLHVLTRLLIPLLPLSLAATLDAFLSSLASPSPIPMPLGVSPYPYIFVSAVLHFLTSAGGIPSLTKILVSRLGANGDEALSSHYTDHLLALAVGSSKAKSSNDLHAATATGAVSKVLQTVSVLVAAVDDALIGAIVLGVLFGWEFGFIVLGVLGIYGYITCLVARPSLLSSCPAKAYAFAFLQALVASGGLLLGSLYVAKGVTEGAWSAGAWAAWVWYWGLLILPLTWTPSLRGCLGDVRTVFKVLDEPSGLVDGEGDVDGAEGVEVKFDNVSFTYPYTDVYAPLTALSGISFTLPVSSVTAIVGAPGSGKSSVLKALYRLYDIDSGSIFINGTSVRTLSLASLRSTIAVVPDICSEGRARAISRVLSKDAKVVLVEGALDGDMTALVSDKTVLWELGTAGFGGVERVDQILVLKDGQLVESGSFKDLLEADGLFASMWADHLGTSAPVPDSSSATASRVVDGYDVLTPNVEVSVIGDVTHDSPRAVTASIRAPSVRAPSIRPAASVKAESVAPSIPAKDFQAPVSFPSSGSEDPQPTAFASSSVGSAPVAFPTSSDIAPLAFPTSDDSRSISSASQTHIRLPTAITFDTTATPPRVSTPDPTGASSSSPTPDAEGKRKRISSQNFQRLARRISLSTPRKGMGIQGIPGIAGIAGVLRRDTSFKGGDKGNGESSARDSMDAVGPSASAPETARNSGEMGAERADKDKEREEKKRKRKSFMEVVGAKRADSVAATGADMQDAGEA
ncbi:hypothetical protein BDN67DRAFT_962519 [Paxillus ammoniavirescens]|nr:hypothetical protein BDN67DRAFT_962519 [Paxillus ammoniavirescens]